MRGFSISGETKERELKKCVDSIYDSFWRPALELIKLGYLSYTEAMSMDYEDLYSLWYGAIKIEESFSSMKGVK